VLVKQGNGEKHYSNLIGGYIDEATVEMFHIDARTSEQACEKAEKYGRPLGARKANIDKIRGNPEYLKLDNPPDVLQVGDNRAIAMDEMIWLKRNKRRKNLGKDKKGC
jgi:hypothetical protein